MCPAVLPVSFALLTGESGNVDYADSHIWGWLEDGSGKAVLWPKDQSPRHSRRGDRLPMLVRFADIADPKTVERVDPENLAASFGAGYALQRVVVEETDDPVTSGIEKRLRWLGDYFDKMLDGSTINNSTKLVNVLSQLDFQRGMRR